MNLPQLTPDAQGRCELVIDGRHPLCLIVDPERQRLLLVGLLEMPVDLPARQLLTGALNPLFNAGPGVGLDAQSGLCFAWSALEQQQITASRVVDEIARLIEWIDGWRGAING